jgi:hypothetical protein
MKKTNAIFFSNDCRLKKNYVLLNIIFDNVSIPYVDQTKLLGVLIDKKLIFDIHTIDLCKKVSFKIRILIMCVHFYSMLSLKKFYSSFLYFLHMIIVQLFSFILLTKQTVTG